MEILSAVACCASRGAGRCRWVTSRVVRTWSATAALGAGCSVTSKQVSCAACGHHACAAAVRAAAAQRLSAVMPRRWREAWRAVCAIGSWNNDAHATRRAGAGLRIPPHVFRPFWCSCFVLATKGCGSSTATAALCQTSLALATTSAWLAAGTGSSTRLPRLCWPTPTTNVVACVRRRRDRASRVGLHSDRVRRRGPVRVDLFLCFMSSLQCGRHKLGKHSELVWAVGCVRGQGPCNQRLAAASSLRRYPPPTPLLHRVRRRPA